jgi:hypothetical protein
MAKYTYGRKQYPNAIKEARLPKRYFNIQIWDGDKITYSRYDAKQKANAGGNKVTATLNLKMGVELF